MSEIISTSEHSIKHRMIRGEVTSCKWWVVTCIQKTNKGGYGLWKQVAFAYGESMFFGGTPISHYTRKMYTHILWINSVSETQIKQPDYTTE